MERAVSCMATEINRHNHYYVSLNRTFGGWCGVFVCVFMLVLFVGLFVFVGFFLNFFFLQKT